MLTRSIEFEVSFAALGRGATDKQGEVVTLATIASRHDRERLTGTLLPKLARLTELLARSGADATSWIVVLTRGRRRILAIDAFAHSVAAPILARNLPPIHSQRLDSLVSTLEAAVAINSKC